MKSHLVRWQKAFGDKGLVVIEVDNGAADPFEAVKADYKKKGLTFPVLWDRDGKTFAAYGVKSLPWGYLIGADGKVAWEGVALKQMEDVEKRIEAETSKVD